MTHSSYVWSEEYDEHLAFPHNLQAKTGRKRKPRENAAASLVTTAKDYARFLCALLNREGLKPETFDAMMNPQSQLFSEDFPGMFSWGLGVGIQHSQQGDMIWHWGDNGDFKCFFAAFLKQKTGAVYFANSANGLGIAEDLLLAAVGGEYPVFQTPLVNDYPRHDSPMMMIHRAYVGEGFDGALNVYHTFKQQHPGSELAEEPFLNSFGYTLLNQKKYNEAIRVFQMNIELFPDSWNVYDSLGEAYMKAGEKQLAIQNYQRSLELNPDNQGGKSALKRLGVKD